MGLRGGSGAKNLFFLDNFLWRSFLEGLRLFGSGAHFGFYTYPFIKLIN
jgi:hypothetical protein